MHRLSCLYLHITRLYR